jgi:hypothetical protein
LSCRFNTFEYISSDVSTGVLNPEALLGNREEERLCNHLDLNMPIGKKIK